MAGIYIHIPFCKQACNYCNFYFTTSATRKSELVAAICRELALTTDYLNGEVIETIYFGGGTPSLLSVDEIKQILNAIHRYQPRIALQELTLEANPDDLTTDKVAELRSLRAYGLDRLSMGVQSFHEADLLYMNRAHTATEAMDSIKRVQDAGFEKLTIDLIYGTPTMNHEQWQANLDKTFGLGIAHISSYALTVEPKTTLDKHIQKKKALPVDEAHSASQFDILMQQMQQHGYEQYEISNFALPGKYAVHNTNYWRGHKYLGLGSSAHSFDGVSRQWNVANNNNYIAGIMAGTVPFEKEMLSPTEQGNEYIMTALRTMWGLDITDSRLAQYDIKGGLEAVDPTLYIIEGNTLRLTPAGRHYADRIASDLMITGE